MRTAPRNLLRAIPRLELRELGDSELCCGAAGTYNLTEPEMSQRLAERKLEQILATNAQLVVAANAGCLLHIASQARRQGHHLSILHPMDLLDLSYQNRPLEELLEKM